MDMLRSILKDHLLTSFKDHILLDLRTDLKIILFNLQDFLGVDFNHNISKPQYGNDNDDE